MAPEKPCILMLEDDPDDRLLTEDSVREFGYDSHFTYLTYSEELFDHLEAQEKPRLIVIDYNCKPQSAPQVLSRLKSDPEYQTIPVVVLGESGSEAAIRECYRLGANSFIVKPDTDQKTYQKIKAFLEYWLQVVEL